MRSPENRAGIDARNSIFQKICARLARNDRARFTRSGSTVRSAPSTLTMIGKNTMRTATRIFGVTVNPNHRTKSGANATFGAIWRARMYGESTNSVGGDIPRT